MPRADEPLRASLSLLLRQQDENWGEGFWDGAFGEGIRQRTIADTSRQLSLVPVGWLALSIRDCSRMYILRLQRENSV